MLENGATRVAIEIDDEASHNPRLVSQDKFYDDLLKQNSMIHLGWDVYRWAVRQMQKQPETVKDELRGLAQEHSQWTIQMRRISLATVSKRDYSALENKLSCINGRSIPYEEKPTMFIPK